MKLTNKEIGKFKDALQEWILGDPERNNIVFEAGLLNDDDISILITPQDLIGNETACGYRGAKHFDQKVVDFLVSCGVKELIVQCCEDEWDWFITGAAIPIPFDDTYPNPEQWLSEDKIKEYTDNELTFSSATILNEMLTARGGSLREDGCSVKGWSTYESE